MLYDVCVLCVMSVSYWDLEFSPLGINDVSIIIIIVIVITITTIIIIIIIIIITKRVNEQSFVAATFFVEKK